MPIGSRSAPLVYTQWCLCWHAPILILAPSPGNGAPSTAPLLAAPPPPLFSPPFVPLPGRRDESSPFVGGYLAVVLNEYLGGQWLPSSASCLKEECKITSAIILFARLEKKREREGCKRRRGKEASFKIQIGSRATAGPPFPVEFISISFIAHSWRGKYAVDS